MIFKHRKTTELPKGPGVIDPAIIKYIDDMGKALRQTLKNIYDDTTALEKAEVVSSLPTASIEYRGKVFIVPQAADDKAYRCVLDTGGGTYSWKEITFV